MGKSAAAVVWGYLIFGITSAFLFRLGGQASGVRPSVGFAALAIAAGMVAAFCGGFLTARLAPQRPRKHAAILAGVLIAIALLSILMKFSGTDMRMDARIETIWSEISVIVLMSPAAYFGGIVQSRRREMQSDSRLNKPI